MAAVAIAGCKGDDASKSAEKEAAKPAAAPATKTPEPPAKVDPNWSKRVIKPVKATVDGLGFEVSLPEGLKQEIKPAKDPFPGFVNWTWPGSFDMPSFTAQLVTFAPRSLEDAKRSLESNKRYAASFSEELPNGYLVAVREKGNKYINTQVWKKYGPGGQRVVRFSIMQRMSNPIPELETQQEWMLEVLRSFKVAKAGATP